MRRHCNIDAHVRCATYVAAICTASIGSISSFGSTAWTAARAELSRPDARASFDVDPTLVCSQANCSTAKDLDDVPNVALSCAYQPFTSL